MTQTLASRPDEPDVHPYDAAVLEATRVTQISQTDRGVLVMRVPAAWPAARAVAAADLMRSALPEGTKLVVLTDDVELSALPEGPADLVLQAHRHMPREDLHYARDLVNRCLGPGQRVAPVPFGLELRPLPADADLLLQATEHQPPGRLQRVRDEMKVALGARKVGVVPPGFEVLL